MRHLVVWRRSPTHVSGGDVVVVAHVGQAVLAGIGRLALDGFAEVRHRGQRDGDGRGGRHVLVRVRHVAVAGVLRHDHVVDLRGSRVCVVVVEQGRMGALTLIVG